MKSILFICSLSMLMFACGKTPQNGALDGKWRLYEIHSKTQPTESTYAVAKDVRADNIYWSFQLNLLSITSAETLNGHTNETVARFAYEGDHLAVTQTYVHFRDRDSLLTDPNTAALETVGIRGNASNFRIAQLSGSRLTLCSERDSLVFRKPN